MSRSFWIILAVLSGGGLILLIANDSRGDVFGIENETFGRLIYLGTLVTVIGAGILGSRHGLGETARSLALWVLIILFLVAGYQYRYELQDIASRVTVGLVPGSPLSITDGEGRKTVTLEKRSNGHFEARILINGKPVSALVDTGATTTVLTAADAARAGYDTQSLRFTIPVSTANGMTNAARAVADEIGIGVISRRNLPILVAEDGRLGQSLLGMNFIGTLSGFDVRGDRMILRD